ncbi:guanylate cyclase domain-containing protein [Haematococcus lacustris]|uniref:Guanylate cyclase domain-containing protein n=1 Tax=Haematococcus lacustris TaxID=44745 RepID=A0A699YJG7_HAELA|nr:guanylate cyclase domain-containing protein [Haematococcus lacustris]
MRPSPCRAVWAVKWHPNAASDINTYYSEYARAAFMHAAWRVLEEGLANMTGIQAELAQIYSATVEATRFTGLLDPQTLYWQQIDFTPSSPPPSPPPPSPPSPPSPPLVVIQVSGRLSSQTLTAAVTTPLLVVGALLVAWITSSYILRQRGQHRSLLGGILPPGVGPATTLMVTDIQDSTALWEALPDHVMDATIALHHATIRACLTAFTAYEVTTEGDSFILATHNPHDALLLATSIHQQLLQCSWFLDACPVRCLRPLSTTFLDAPFSQAAVVYLYVVGLGSLAAWNSQVTATAMGLCLSILNRQLHLYGGYCVEQAESLCLATFCHPHTAIRWALACIQLCLAADWPQELLEHELGEEMLVPTPLTRLSASAAAAALQDARRAKRGRKLIGGVPPKPAAALHPDTSQAAPPVAEVHPPSPDPKAGSSSRLVRVLLRGLRLKAGIDYGPVSASVHAALARMTYTGRVMNSTTS